MFLDSDVGEEDRERLRRVRCKTSSFAPFVDLVFQITEPFIAGNDFFEMAVKKLFSWALHADIMR